MRKPLAPILREGKAESDELDFDIDRVVQRGNIQKLFVSAVLVIRKEPLRNMIEGVRRCISRMSKKRRQHRVSLGYN
jgi:hypothetical protein